MEAQENQAGGHTGRFVQRDGKILKKAKAPERAFYAFLYSPELQDEHLIEFRKFPPAYYGTETVNGKTHMILEDLTINYQHASLLDCKLGRITYSRDQAQIKIDHQIAKQATTTSGSLGFRIAGICIKDDAGNITESWSHHGKHLNINKDNIYEQFLKAVTRNGQVQPHVINKFIADTEEILAWWRKQRSKHFITTSLLYINGINGCQTRIVDFSRVYDAEGTEDNNVIEGLENVIRIWHQVKQVSGLE
ncbi:unnamed protein product [Blepharisma stoltei]|uniref:Kinase n=1 Tax=Blepharisma stoltei TaxID=1481888 RepID=A0AAU9K918_9CILI|nr:unnamed protein product [Blepharisma stoltei]